ncbi:MAG: alpha/beta fold hydrolase, partial [Candidatus Eremiobacteraeota bacterium]|nr:alpha/beta fold hydrolase [Candidatus Eremiobacteraeota bacterium]
PHRDAASPSAGTLLAMEGGPGFPSGASFRSYETLFHPLLARYDMLLVDDRGTGRSGALLCKALQAAPVMTLTDIDACGATLGTRADLYGTAIASDDVAAVVDALGAGEITLYGDSYGTFMAQTFVGRHPEHVRAIVLDGAYPVVGSDPWLASVAIELRRAFDAVCRRSPYCSRLPGNTLSRLQALLTALRRDRALVTPTQVAFVMASAGLNPAAYRDFDAAARAYLAGDVTPLRRLVRDVYRYEEESGADYTDSSAALFVAASCSDNPVPYDRTLTVADRQAQWTRIEAAQERRNPALYAPFTIAEFLGMPPDYGYVNLCLNWPVPSAAHAPREPLLPDPRLPDVPALVLVGDLDTITTPQESAAAARLFPHAAYVVVRNTGHVTAVGDVYDCAAAIVRRFVATLATGDTSCASRIPPRRLVSFFARTTSWRFSDRDAAIAAAQDALARIDAYGVTSGSGLRGGSFYVRNTDDLTAVTLDGAKWCDDAPVWGSVLFNRVTGSATLRATLPGRRHVIARWNEFY